MLYKFKSPVAADVIMLPDVAKELLKIIGKDPGATGIITCAQIPGAIAAIQAEVARRQAQQQQPDQPFDDPALAEAAQDQIVNLSQRASPFIKLLQASADEGKDVVWGV